MIGQIVGNYEITAKLGEGGMGAVYKGVDTMLDREVAIKVLRPELVSQTEIVERFRSEATTLAKLHHSNIATLYSLFRQGEELYMVLEYVRGETLDAILQRRGSLAAEQVIPMFCQILDGIDHAHEFGIVHRDIKPANIMLTEKGTLKVLDFGIARLLGTNRMTRAGNIIGTLEYMAPEQVRGQETDARSDIYALGMMLYEILTGHAPFETTNEFELMRLQTETMPPGARSINPAIPEEVERAIMIAVQKNPADRFQTAGDFREALLDTGLAARHAPRQPTAPEIKQTAFAAASTASLFDSGHQEQPQSESFFSKLSWIHYAGAGVAALALIGLLIAVPLFLFSGGAPETNNKSSVLTGTQKPQITAPPESIVKYRIKPLESDDSIQIAPSPLSLDIAIKKDGSITLNSEAQGRLGDDAPLLSRLTAVIKARKEVSMPDSLASSGVKHDTLASLNVEPEVNYREVAVLIGKIRKTGVNPLLLTVNQKKISVASSNETEPDQAKILNVSISDAGEYFIGGEPVAAASFAAKIAEQLKSGDGNVFVSIAAGSQVAFGGVSDLLKDISQSSQPETSFAANAANQSVMNSVANMPANATNSNLAAGAFIKDPKVLKAIKKLVEIRGRAVRTGNKDALSKILDDSYTEGGDPKLVSLRQERKLTKQEVIERAKRVEDFSFFEITDCELEANDGVNATVSCSEYTEYKKLIGSNSFTNNYTAVRRNGEWLLTRSEFSILMDENIKD